MKVRLAHLVVGLVVVALVLGGHTRAQAHTPSVKPTCDGLSVKLSSYEPTGNTLKVTIDGTVVEQRSFPKNLGPKVYPWTPSGDHVWTVTIRTESGQYDRDFSGTWHACPVTTTTEVASSVPTTVPNSSAPSTPAPGTAASTPVSTPATSTTLLSVEPPVSSTGTSTSSSTSSTTGGAASTTTTSSRTSPGRRGPELPGTGLSAFWTTFVYGAVILVGLGISLTVVGVRRRRSS